jgi:hypothetical protein
MRGVDTIGNVRHARQIHAKGVLQMPPQILTDGDGLFSPKGKVPVPRRKTGVGGHDVGGCVYPTKTSFAIRQRRLVIR